jgi:DNA-binding PadR family transcriptional regulator
MPKKSLESLTEPMFYVLMAFRSGPKCGIEIAGLVEKQTEGRIKIGPATLYTVLGKFLEVEYLEEIDKDQPGRKRTYQITRKGLEAYSAEIKRLRYCLHDAKIVETEKAKEQEKKS